MLQIRSVYAGILLLALTQCLVFASQDREKNRTEISIELIGNYLTLPWMDGLKLMDHASESLDVKEVRTFIRAIMAGETWATQILETQWQSHPRLGKRHIRYSKICDDCTRVNVDKDTDMEDGNCMASAVDTVSAKTGICVAMSDPSLPNKTRNDQTTDEVTHSTPGGSKDFTTFFFSIVSVVLIGCTICDFVNRNSPGDSSATVHTLAKFSLYTNAHLLLDTKSTDVMMPAINGLRCLCFWTVIVGHRYLVSALVLKEKIMLLDFIKTRTTLFGVYMEMTIFAVDTFCVIGGFFLAHMFFKIKNSGSKFNVIAIYLYRYLRLTPCLAVLLIFVVVFSHRFGNGSAWEGIITAAVDPCRENWWINLLYLQNIIAPDRMCMVHTWYLALDMQLFWLSPLILYPLYNAPKFGLRLLSILFVVSAVTPVIFLAVNGYSNVLLRLDMELPKLLNNFSYYYVATYNRAFPYLVGILLGYDMATKRRHLTKLNVTMNWIFTGSLILFCTWLTSRTLDSGFVGDWDMEVLAAILLRPVWSIAIAWVIYACTQGYGGLATRFLSLPIFLPLSRLSYCIYLVHMVIQGITIFSLKGSANPLSSSNILSGTLCDLALSSAVAFILHLLIERPFIVFTKILLNNRRCKPEAAVSVKESEQKL